MKEYYCLYSRFVDTFRIWNAQANVAIIMDIVGNYKNKNMAGIVYFKLKIPEYIGTKNTKSKTAQIIGCSKKKKKKIIISVCGQENKYKKYVHLKLVMILIK